MQLELDFSLVAPDVRAAVSPPDIACPLDLEIERFLRGRMAYGTPRQRQGVPHRLALPAPELRKVTAELRSRIADKDPVAITEAVALLAGIPLEHAGQICTGDARSGLLPAIRVDLRTGQMLTNMGRICLGQAAAAPANGTALPASHMLVKPLPGFLVRALREAAAGSTQAATLTELLPCVLPSARVPIAGDSLGRLRPTHARARAGLSAFAISLGLDNYDAALVTNDFALVDKSRLFYVRSEPRHIFEGCQAVYDALGWGPPVAIETTLPFGSMVVAQEDWVQDVFIHLRQRAADSLPGRRYTLDSLLTHHNHYALLVGWLLSFCVGARESNAYDFTARNCHPAALFVPYRDKLTGPFKQLRPVFLCKVAREQVAAWWSHLRTLQERVCKLGLPPRLPWLAHLNAIFANSRVPLLFLVWDDVAVPLGSGLVEEAIPPALRLVRNAGRHVWQTRLYRERISSQAIDQFARHACRGTESLSSTTLLSPGAAHQLVCGVQDKVLQELEIRATGGLGQKGTP
jgi:hypothetical protein